MIRNKVHSILKIAICSLLLIVTAMAFVCCGDKEESSGEATGGKHTVHFELCTDLTTNVIKDRIVEDGKLVDEPTVAVRGENPRSLQIVGWYTDAEYTVPWDFDFDVVTGDITLYAKWEGRYTVNFYLGDEEKPLLSSMVKEGRKTEPCDDKCYGYEVLGYYTSRDYTEEFDFNKPVMGNTDVFIKVSGYLYYDATSISNGFVPFAGQGGSSGSATAGTIVYEEKDGESYARVDFGYSNSNDPYIAIEYTSADIRRSQSIEITLKNLGDAYQMGLNFVVKDQNGYVGKSEYNAGNSIYQNLGTNRNMSEDDEWITVRFDIAELNLNWREATSVYLLRLESNYNSENPTANPAWGCKPETTPNVMLIKSIRGVYNEKYDQSKAEIFYHIGDNIATQRATLHESIERNDSACAGYKVKGYYTDPELTKPYDFNSIIYGETHIYVDVENYIYFDAKAISTFVAYPPTDKSGKEGSIELSANGDYAIVNFGYSPALADAHIALRNVEIATSACSKLQFTIKNLGSAVGFGMFWTGVDYDGNVVEQWVASHGKSQAFGASQKNMSADGEWITITFDLSDMSTWTNLKTITGIRIDSKYVSADKNDLSNVWLIKEIVGVYDEKYDRSKAQVTYHIGDNVATERVSVGKPLTRNDAACVGYKVLGYYTDKNCTVPYDFNAVITGDTDIYVKADSFIYFSAASLAKFTACPSTDGNGGVGAISLSENKDYAIVDFGYALGVADSHIMIRDLDIEVNGCSTLELTIKNLGPAYAYRIYWLGEDTDGNIIKDWNEANGYGFPFTSGQMNMSADEEWITISIDLSTVDGWKNLEKLTALRIQSQYKASSETDLVNIWHVKDIQIV